MAVDDLVLVDVTDPIKGPRTMREVRRDQAFDSAWQIPTFLNSWANYSAGGTPYQVARYYKTSNGMVVLEGLIKNDAATHGDTVFTLPSGYWPAKRLVLQGYGSIAGVAGSYRIDMVDTGQLVVVGKTSTVSWISISNSFFASTI